MKALILLTALAGTAVAQEAAPTAQSDAVDEVMPAPQAETKPAPEAEPAAEPKAEPPVESKPEPILEKPAKIEVVSAKVEETKPLPPAGIDEEWAFVKSSAEDADGAVSEAAMEDLQLFVLRHPESAQAPEAMFLLAGLKQKKGEWQSALTVYLRLLYEYPANKTALRAKSSYLELVEKKGSRKQRPLLSELVKLPEAADRADRLCALWQKAAEQVGETLSESVAEEIRDFSVRFQNHKDGDKMLSALARLQGANGKAAASMLAWRKLLAMHPNSPLRPQAQMAMGDLYADSVRDPKKAIDAYQDLVEKYPKAPEMLGAIERSAHLFDDKLRQYDLAVEMHEKIVKNFPKTAGSLRALKAMARLQRERLSKPEEALKILMQLSQMHGGQDGVDALLQASEVARRDLKDSRRQAELLRKISDDYAGAKEAPQSLYDAAGVYEDDLKDNAKAIEVYREVASKFPSHKLAKKATDRAAKLEAK
ncbi:MAG TPA: hypothetical protein DCZ01_00775 [Elusimicrobia bacterium]|nr:MAG: hypothetical protein A2X37_03965 [Elusimicrobia bacterium GWA2_66_18]HAZ07066.1 hypothetical protein [Elusimicrobiota bacterium]